MAGNQNDPSGLRLEPFETAFGELDDGDLEGAVYSFAGGVRQFLDELEEYEEDGWVSARVGLENLSKDLLRMGARIRRRRG